MVTIQQLIDRLEEEDPDLHEMLLLDQKLGGQKDHAQLQVDAAALELESLVSQKAQSDEKIGDAEGICLEEFRAISDACHFQRQKWHGGAPNGPDCMRFLAASKFFVEILKPSYVVPASAVHFQGCSKVCELVQPARRGKLAAQVAQFVNKCRLAKARRTQAKHTVLAVAVDVNKAANVAANVVAAATGLEEAMNGDAATDLEEATNGAAAATDPEGAMNDVAAATDLEEAMNGDAAATDLGGAMNAAAVATYLEGAMNDDAAATDLREQWMVMLLRLTWREQQMMLLPPMILREQ